MPTARSRRSRPSRFGKATSVIIEDGDPVPGDGEIVEGVALVDESAVTGESAPVIREAKGDRSAVTGGTRILSGKIRVMITANPGETFLDHMISMVESAKRQKTPNEVALEILLVGLTVLFIVVVGTLSPFAAYGGVKIAMPVLVSLLVCLIPTTIGGLLPAIGIAGMDRLIQHNVIALSGRAVEAAGDVDVVLLDKTGTITLGNRMATDFIPASDVTRKSLPRRRSSHRSRTRPLKDGASWPLPSTSSLCGGGISRRPIPRVLFPSPPSFA